MTVSSREGIADVYSGEITARRYVADRFASELYRLLHDRQVAAINRTIEMFPNGRFLEIAPGPGRITRDVRHRGTVVCLEYNWDMIAIGRNGCKYEVRWVRGDAFHLPFRQEFDVAYAFRFVRHFHQEDRHLLYAQVRRVLKPGAYFLFDALNARGPWPRQDRMHSRSPFPPVYDKFYRSIPELRDEMSAAGFEVMSLEPVHRCYRAQYLAQVLIAPRSRWLCRVIIRGLERLAGGPPMEWIVTCRCA